MSEMFFAYLVQKFLQFLFTHYFLFLSIISRLFGLKLRLESRDSSSSYNHPLQKEQIQCLLLWTDKHQVLVRFKRMPESRALGSVKAERSSQTVYFEFIRDRQNKCTLCSIVVVREWKHDDWLLGPLFEHEERIWNAQVEAFRQVNEVWLVPQWK